MGRSLPFFRCEDNEQAPLLDFVAVRRIVSRERPGAKKTQMYLL